MSSKRFLIIVESPAKSKIIKKYLEKAYPNYAFDVEASFGHVRDLEKKNLGVDLDSYAVKYVLNAQKRDVVDKLVRLAGKCDKVLLASDNDREGEAIAWHLREVLKLKANGYKRMVFNEITERALKSAFENLKGIDMDLVNAQQTRRIVDRVVGFKLTPLLWGTFKVDGGTTLSAGRVQSAALKYIIDKEREIQAHVPEAYWTVKAAFAIRGKKEVVEDCKLYDKGSGVLKRFASLGDARAFLTKLKGDFKIVSSKLHDSKSSPDAPFITSTLQQEAAAKLGFSVKMTMGLAQQLYEKGLITYMRTDSYALSSQALDDTAKYIAGKYGADMGERRDYAAKRKVKNGQEAHEAIRPTDFKREELKAGTGDGAMRRLYELIHKRTVASQMRAAVYSVLDVCVQDASMIPARSKHNDCEFRGKFSVVKNPGYLVVYGEKAGDLAWLTRLSEEIDRVVLHARELGAKNTWSGAPSRYNEAALIKVLERDGIGRPSTYAGILEKLYQKSYVAVQNTEGTKHENVDLKWKSPGNIVEEKYESISNAEMNRMVPTDIGQRIHGYLEEHFLDVIGKDFTSQMEGKLDEIAEGSAEWKQVLGEFWGKLRPRVEAAAKLVVRPKDKEMLQVQREEFVVDGNKYTVRLGKYGPLIEKQVEKGTPKEYVGLTAYLKLTKKAYSELSNDEVEMLVNMPMRIGAASANAELRYGRYGFYVVIDGENYMLPMKWVRQEFGGWQNIGGIKPKHLAVIKQMKKEYLEKKKDGAAAKPKKTKPKK